MATASIGGLASGLDTATIIDQLIQLEAATQTKLKSKVTSQQAESTALQGVNSKLAALVTSATALATGTTSGVWATLQATSSSTSVAVTARSNAAPSTISVGVTQTALTHRLAFGQATGLTTAGAVPTSVTLARGADTVEITSDGTLGGLVNAINAADSGVRASAVKVADGSYRLLVESSTTGAAQAFTLTETGTGAAVLGGPEAALTQTARDAIATVGGISVTSTTNTFTDVLDGVDITLASTAAPGTTAEVTITRDAKTRASATNDFVTAINATLGLIASVGDPKTGSVRANSTLRSVSSSLVETIYPPDGTSLASIGIETDRYGKITFDQDKFAAAFAADPAGTQSAFAAFADRVKTAATAASDASTGTVTAAVNSRNATITQLNQSIKDWDDRLALRRTTLERQFTALEVAMSQMQSQSNWLAGQLASLPGSGS